MKKILARSYAVLISSFALLITISGLAYAATREIPIIEILAATNTATETPAGNLADNNPGTVWWTSETTPGSAWIEVKLSIPALIEGLQFYGEYQGELAVEYWQEGWHQFLAARFLKGSTVTSGWNILDLSYDRIATDRLRLMFTNPENKIKLGGIAELKILGLKNADVFERLDPVTVTTNRRAESEHPVEYLFDHNTYTSWRLKPGMGSTPEVVADLGEICAVKRVKIFGQNEEKDKSKEPRERPTIFTVQYLQDNNWANIPGMENLDATQIGAAWKRFDLSGMNIVTNRIRVLLNGYQRNGGLKEIEIWGTRSSVSGSRYLFGSASPVSLNGTQPANYSISVAKPVTSPVYLHLTGMGNSPASLTWELNGKAMGTLTQTGVNHGFSVFTTPIASRDLWDGVNFIRVNGDKMTLYDCRVEIVPSNRFTPAVTGALTDRWLLTAANEGEEIIDFGGHRDIDELILKSLGSFPNVQIAIDRDGQWVDVTGPYRAENGAEGGEMIYNDIGPARRIKVTYSPVFDGLTELNLNSSLVNDGLPQVKILAPPDGECLSLADWTKQTLRGTVDNPDVTLKINGHPVNLDGTSFTVRLSELGLKEYEEKTIEAIATDGEGRAGSDRITVMVGMPPEFTVNLPEQISYTKDSQINVTGKVVSPNSKVTVNGLEVPVQNRTFATNVKLREGFNAIIIKVSVNDKFKIVNTKVRYVVSNSAPPYLKVLYPADMQIIRDDKLNVSGEVSSLNTVNVTVNGQPAAVNSGSFSSPAIMLAEGENRLVVLATDQAGLVSRVELKAYRDTIRPFLSNIAPLDNTNLNTSMVVVSGSVKDTSPTSVLVNGVAATITNTQFNAAVVLPEGWNDLKIVAIDCAGNTATEIRKTFIDTKSPAAFIPTADPSGWTNNNRPVITFGTTDAESGIGHYEMSVAGGNWINPVISPYQCTQAIPDGEQTIRVKAVDKAGNETVGQANVYIDTLPPAAPEGFEVISGIGKVGVKWQDPLGEIVGYRLMRTPAFVGTSYREFIRNEAGDKMDGYTDMEVTPGASYTYSVRAIDRGGNYGAETGLLRVKVGIAVQDVSGSGGTVKFDQCEVTLPQETFTETVKVLIHETAEQLPENTYAAPVSPAYSFKVQDATGRTMETEFAKPVDLRISYADLRIPDGFDTGSLGIYWFNTESGEWEKLEHVANDFENKTLSVPLAHFSDYQVMASNYVTPTLNSYYNLGISPYGSYFQDNVESVSPMSGGLSVSATDLKLPGRNGMDFVIKRIYDSGAAQQEKLMAVNGERIYKAPVATFGCGWSLNIPWIESSDKGKFIRLPEGQTIKIEWKNGVFEYHEGVHFILKVNTFGFLGSGNNFFSIKDYILILKDGTTYEFERWGKPIRQTDPSGKNNITFHYKDYNLSREITSIVDSAGRSINFTYETAGSNRVIDKITAGNRTWDYNYYQDGTLSESLDPLKRKTVYKYIPETLNTGCKADIYKSRRTEVYIDGSFSQDKSYYYSDSGHTDTLKSYVTPVLKEIVYPTNTSSVYTYEIRSQGDSESWNEAQNHEESSYGWKDPETQDKWVEKITKTWSVDRGSITVGGSKIVYLSNTVMNKVTSYRYDMNKTGGSLRYNTFVAPNTYIISSTTDDGVKAITEKYRQMIKDTTNKLAGNLSYDQLSKYKGNIMVSRLIMPNGSSVLQSVSYEYNMTLRAVTKEQHRRGYLNTIEESEPIYEVTSQYDNWGNLTYRFDGSRHAEETWKYRGRSFTIDATSFTINYLVSENAKKNWNSLTSTYSTVTTIYHYNESVWKPDSVKVTAGTQTLETTYTYYDAMSLDGSLKTKTDPNGLITEFIYDGNGFLSQKSCHGDAAHPFEEIITEYQYNKDTGMKLWEAMPRKKGTTEPVRKTIYEYDALNRITKVTLPDDDAISTNNPYREYDFFDTPDQEGYNYCLFRDENGNKTRFNFDGLGRLTKVDKDPERKFYPDYLNGVVTVYHYDDLGRIDTVTDPNGNVSTYAYDGLNRVTKVTFPKSNSSEIIAGAVNLVVKPNYEDLTNTVTIVEYENSETGKEIGRTTETSDWANRLISAVQNCKYNSADDSYNWQFSYDSSGNKLQQIDPLVNQTNQTYDALGHLMEAQLPTVSLVLRDDGWPESTRPTLNYEYDDMGNKKAEVDAKGNRVEYGYDELGRVITVTSKAANHLTNQLLTAVTKNYYDAAGNKTKVIDASQKEWSYTYSVRGWLLTEEDPLHNITRYQYDALGNKIAVTDPRGNGVDGKYTTWYIYDNLNRIVRTVLPDNTPPNVTDLKNGNYDNPYTEITYDENGNKLTERDANGIITSFTYTPRNSVETVTVSGQLKATYTYDAKGNQIEIKDAVNQVTKQDYDSLGRLRKVTHPLANFEEFSYDAVGNKTAATDGRGNKTQYFYNPLGYLTGVKDPLYNMTQYQYDLNGNQVKIIAPNSTAANKMETKNYYDEMNRVYKTVDTLGKSTMYCYYANGNRQKMTDRRGSAWIYQYYDNNQLQRVDVTNGAQNYWVSYIYDKAGNRVQVQDSGNTVNYNTDEHGIYQADPLNWVNNIGRSFGGATYTTSYQYSKGGSLTKILYPETTNWLEYKYNNQNQLNEVVGFTLQQGISYKADGSLDSITYANGVSARYGYDNNRRLNDLQVSIAGKNILQLGYAYYDDNNIRTITDGGKVKTYQYDANGQLTKATTPGKFVEEKPAAGFYGIKRKDYNGSSLMDFMPGVTGLIGVDYNASSVGIDFGTIAPKIKKIVLTPGKNYETHRIANSALDLYTSNDNANYTVIQRSDWEFVKDSKGVITITLKATIAARYLKLHVKYDNWDEYGNPVNENTFLNEVAKMLQVYQEADTRVEEYQYDAAGNRTFEQITLIQVEGCDSLYYANSDRLKTDGKFAFKYDDAGNLTEKGNKFTINDDEVIFTATSGEEVEYWQYGYDLLNRLILVKKNGSIISEYGYDPEGLRVVKKANGQTIHYVFEGTEPIFEKNVTAGKVKSFVYAFGKNLARVDGVIGDPDAKKYWYHTDHLGSVRAVTDKDGKKVFDSDYYAFGSQYGKNISESSFDEWHGFNGKKYDSDIGLYYYNARWYDPELGRFISEDTVIDPNNSNIYSYCANNPLRFTDPTGNLTHDEEMNKYYGGLSNQTESLSPPNPSMGTPENTNLGIGAMPTTTAPAPSGSSTQGTVFEYDNLVIVKDNAGNVINAYSRDEMKDDLQKLAGLQQTAYTTGNIDAQQTAIDFANSVKNKYKDFFDATKDRKGGISVIGLRGFGVGTPCQDTEKIKGEKNTYNDMLVVLGTNGNLDVFSRVNFEGTTATGTYGSETLNNKGYPAIANGVYDLQSSSHLGNYRDVILSANGGYDIPIIGKNPQTGKYTASGIEIHKGGNDWTWSKGCITIYAPKGDTSRWDRFISLFPTQPIGTRVGSLNLMTL